MENNERLISGADERTKMTGARYKSIYRCANTRYRRAKHRYRRVFPTIPPLAILRDELAPPRSLASLSSRKREAKSTGRRGDKLKTFFPRFFSFSFSRGKILAARKGRTAVHARDNGKFLKAEREREREKRTGSRGRNNG